MPQPTEAKHLRDPDDADSGECGDEGECCDACNLKEEAYWASYFGLRPGMTREERRNQLAAFAPPGREEELS
jgi:hypothetical protein